MHADTSPHSADAANSQALSQNQSSLVGMPASPTERQAAKQQKLHAGKPVRSSASAYADPSCHACQARLWCGWYVPALMQGGSAQQPLPLIAQQAHGPVPCHPHQQTEETTMTPVCCGGAAAVARTLLSTACSCKQCAYRMLVCIVAWRAAGDLAAARAQPQLLQLTERLKLAMKLGPQSTAAMRNNQHRHITQQQNTGIQSGLRNRSPEAILEAVHPPRQHDSSTHIVDVDSVDVHLITVGVSRSSAPLIMHWNGPL
jgi:hypothetical protein